MDVRIPDKIPRIQQAISVLWPSFLTAIIATGIFFSAFNPRDLIPFNLDIDISPLAAYSIGFFFVLGTRGHLQLRDALLHHFEQPFPEQARPMTT